LNGRKVGLFDLVFSLISVIVADLRMRVLYSVNNFIRTNLVGGNAICVARDYIVDALLLR
jgi:hypothetical protein